MQEKNVRRSCIYFAYGFIVFIRFFRLFRESQGRYKKSGSLYFQRLPERLGGEI